MMKNISLLMLLGLFVMNSAWTAEKATEKKNEISPNGGSDSCGLGWQVTKSKTLMGTSTRGTTNAYLSPSWSMTSGTSGCEKHPFSKKDEDALKYVSTNFYPLSAEMAEGKGEYLVAFAQVMGCNESVTADFQQMTQKSFKSITENADAYEVIQNVKSELHKSTSLAQNCTI